jgi:hypothetical protein
VKVLGYVDLADGKSLNLFVGFFFRLKLLKGNSDEVGLFAVLDTDRECRHGENLWNEDAI